MSDDVRQTVEAILGAVMLAAWGYYFTAIMFSM